MNLQKLPRHRPQIAKIFSSQSSSLQTRLGEHGNENGKQGGSGSEGGDHAEKQTWKIIQQRQ